MILIVGGAGYIGSHVNKELHKQGYKTIVLDSLVYGHKEFVQWGEFIQGDMGDKELLHSIFLKYDIEAVMHLAAFAYVGESVENPSKYYNNNVLKTVTLLDVMVECKINKFIFSSTCAVYGHSDTLPIDEITLTNPINPYGKSKLMVEEILSDYNKAYDLNFIALRYFNAAGADLESEVGEKHLPETHLIPLVLDVAIAKREDIKVFGTDYDTHDGTAVRDYIHVSDIAKAHIKAFEYLVKKNTSDIFNLGNGKGFSVREIIHSVEKVTGKNIKTVDCPRREGDPSILIGNYSKAENILEWQPQISNIDEIIESAWLWHQKI